MMWRKRKSLEERDLEVERSATTLTASKRHPLTDLTESDAVKGILFYIPKRSIISILSVYKVNYGVFAKFGRDCPDFLKILPIQEVTKFAIDGFGSSDKHNCQQEETHPFLLPQKFKPPPSEVTKSFVEIDEHTSRSLQKHITQEKLCSVMAYQCETCKRCFSTWYQISQHMNSWEHWAPTFDDWACIGEFDSQHAAGLHTVMWARNQFTDTFCTECDRQFISPNNYCMVGK